MAIFKTDDLISGLSGKIGGQSLSYSERYNTIRNIVQPKLSTPISRAHQKVRTAAIASRWKLLTPSQKLSYETEAANYTYKNSFGADVARSGYGLFLFLDHNLSIINQTAPPTAPPFVPVPSPEVTAITEGINSYFIKASNTDPAYNYYIFVTANLRPGNFGSLKYEKFITNITAAQLSAGIDIYTMIASRYNYNFVYPNISIRIRAIHSTTGNSTLNEPVINGLNVDPDYQAILDYANANAIALPTSGQQFLQNQLMLDIKSAVDLSAFDMLFILATDAGQQFAWINWSNGQKFSQTGTWNYFNNLGLSPRDGNGTRFVSNFTPSIHGVAYTLNNASYGWKVGNTSGGWAAGDILLNAAGTSGSIIQINGTNQQIGLNSNFSAVVNGPPPTGRLDETNVHYVANRINATQLEYFKSSVLKVTTANNSVALPDVQITFGDRSGGFPTKFTLLHLGRALTLAEYQNLEIAINNYLAAI